MSASSSPTEVSSALVRSPRYIFNDAQLHRLVANEAAKLLAVEQFESCHLMVSPPDVDPQKALKGRARRLADILPPLSGPHQVGLLSAVIEGPLEKGDRAIGMEIYMPKRHGGGERCLMAIPQGDSLAATLSCEQIRTLRTHSTPGLEPVGDLPILIFSHGLGQDPVVYRLLLEQLASHGIIVLSLNHPSSSFFDPYTHRRLDLGRLNEWEQTDVPKFKAEIEGFKSILATNLEYVVGRIRDGSLENIPRDSKIFLGGHSLGGAASIAAARKIDVAGCINLDGELSEKDTARLDTPLLLIVQDLQKLLSNPETSERDRANAPKVVAGWRDLFHNSRPNFHGGKIQDITHMSFSAFPILEWLLGGNGLSGALKAHQIAVREIRNFITILQN